MALNPLSVDDELLMALGWCITSKNGRVVEVEPPDDAAAPADFPNSFASTAQAVAYLQERLGFVAAPLADKVVLAAVADVVNCNSQVVGWARKPPRPLRSALPDIFPRKPQFVVALRPQEFSTEADGSMEGEGFFSPINFLQALMAAEAGEAGAPSFPGLDHTGLQRIVLDEMFCAAWRVLEAEADSWMVELTDFEEGVDDVIISYRADSSAAWTPVFQSKRDFLRACLQSAATRGFPAMPVAALGPQDREHPRAKDVAFCKIMAPRYGYTWRCTAAGKPVFVPKAPDAAAEGAPSFHSINDILAHFAGVATVGAPVPPPAPRQPLVQLPQQHAQAPAPKPTASAASSASSAAAAQKPAAQKPKPAAPTARPASAPVASSSASSAAAAAAASKGVEGLRSPRPEEVVDISSGPYALCIDDEWPRFQYVLPQLGWGYDYFANGETLLLPKHRGKKVDLSTMVEGVDFFTNKEQVVPIVQAYYKTSATRTDVDFTSPRDVRALIRKGQLPAEAAAAAAASATAGKKTPGSAAQQPKRPTPQQFSFQKTREKPRQPRSPTAPQDDDEDTYEDITGAETFKELWAILKSRHGWHYINGGLLVSFLYCRTRKPKKGEDRPWELGKHFFHSEEEVYDYVMDKVQARQMAEAHHTKAALDAAAAGAAGVTAGGGRGRKRKGEEEPEPEPAESSEGEEDEENADEETEAPAAKRAGRGGKQQQAGKGAKGKGKAAAAAAVGKKKGAAGAGGKKGAEEAAAPAGKGRRASAPGAAAKEEAAKGKGGRKSEPGAGAKRVRVKVEPPAEAQKQEQEQEEQPAPKAKGGKKKKEAAPAPTPEPAPAPMASPSPSPAPYFYWLNLDQSDNWIWTDMKWHGWKCVKGPVRDNPDEGGNRYATPFYDKETKCELGVDWFKSVPDAVAFVRSFVEAGQPFPSQYNGQTPGNTPASLPSANKGKGKKGRAAATASSPLPTVPEPEDEEEETDAEEPAAAPARRKGKGKAQESQPLSGFEEDDELVSRLIAEHGFRQEGGRFIPPEGSARGERGTDYFEDVEELRDYVMYNLQGLPPTQAPPAAAARAGAGAGAAEAAEDADEDCADGEEGAGKGKQSAGGQGMKSARIVPADLEDKDTLVRKLTKGHGWKQQWVRTNGLVDEYVYIPPGGHVRGGVEGVTYCVTLAQIRKLVIDEFFKGQEDLIEQYAVPVVEEIDPSMTRKRHFSLGGGSNGADGEEGQEEDDESGESDEEDEEEEDEEDEEMDDRRTEPDVGGEASEMDVDEEAAGAEGMLLEDEETRPLSAAEAAEPAGAALAARPTSAKKCKAPDEWFQREAMLSMLRDNSTVTAAYEILRKSHGWNIGPCKSFLTASGQVFVAPGAKRPEHGGQLGVEYVTTLEELILYLEKGYGLRPFQDAPIEEVLRPDEATAVLSPAIVCGTTGRATRSGRRFSSLGAAESSPPPLLLEEEGAPDPIDQFCLPLCMETAPAAEASAAAAAAAAEANNEAGKGKGKRRRSSRGNLPFSPEADEEEPAARPSVGARAKRSHSYLTPGGGVASGGKRKRASIGGAAAVPGAGGLTAAEVDRYTHSALKGKGWAVQASETGSASGRNGGGSGVEYELQQKEGDMVLERRGPFATEAEALADAREDGQGKGQRGAPVVTLEEVVAHAQACPYRPIIAEMEAARGRLSEGACAGGAGYVPGVREAESARMLAFYKHHLLRGANAGTGGGGGWLRVAGLPGTGKTIAVQHSEERLRAALAERDITAYPTFVHVNAAARAGPLEILRKICGELGLAGVDRADADALWAKLEERLVSKARGGRPSTAASSSSAGTTFMSSLLSPVKAMSSLISGGASSSKGGASPELSVAPTKASEVAGRAVVLVLDEIDQFLAGRKANAEWLQRLVEGVLLDRGSRLLLVTIANTVEEQSTLGALWAKATTARGGDENASPHAARADPAREPVIFSAFSSEELKALLTGAVGGVIHERGLDLILKRVETSRGDARLAMDICRRALEAHARQLEAKARAWSLADDPQPTVGPGDREVTIPEANTASRELDLDLAKAVESMPQMAKLLLLVLLHMTGEGGAGGKVKLADLQAEYTAQARNTVGAGQLSASGCFDTNLDWLDQNGLSERSKGRGQAVAPKVDWGTVVPKLNAQDKRLFGALLPQAK